ncbi:uncharacterized protein LOC141610951 [Silene latifolia]|uniref:uncharacterized protein LOC141610951 n=1 Tax=Silene latifolia TaxID=37657 RepID=UPI003D777A45
MPDQMVGQDVNPGINHSEKRIRLPGLVGAEVNTVLGGGVVPGSMIFVGGNPGVGKSTLALQMAALIAESCDVGGSGPVSYICGEENVQQIRDRADRLSINTKDLFLYRSTDVEDVLEKMRLLSPRAVVVDSIQTMYLKGVIGKCGGLAQLKECTIELLHFAKQTNIPVISTGHVNKSGDLAGPRTLDHIVDTVLYLDGEKHSSRRILRLEKNRFGSTDELGVFEMSNSGLKAVSNPSEMFLREEHSDSERFIGHAIAALCVPELGASTDVNGVQLSRARFIASVLRQQARLELENHSISLNIINGVSLKETSGDLAVAATICSSFMELPLPNDMAFIGEIGLGGELITVPKIEKSVNTLAKLGYKTCVIPESAVKALEGLSSKIQIIGCKNLKQVIDKVFKRLEWLQPCSVSPL